MTKTECRKALKELGWVLVEWADEVSADHADGAVVGVRPEWHPTPKERDTEFRQARARLVSLCRALKGEVGLP